ncbi:MAG: GTP 3',8-cyclase MoaA [Spirochaetota bacterium]
MGEGDLLRDGRGRVVRYLRISITDRCNLRCRYCMPPGGVPYLSPGRVLGYEQIVDLAGLLVSRGVDKIRVTGGEPLVRRGVGDLFAMLGGVPLRELTLTTNGLLLEEHAQELARAGVRRVNVSLDSLRPDRYREITGTDGLQRVLGGIHRAKELGMGVKINTVVMEGVNRGEAADLLRFAMERSCHVRFIELMPHAHNAHLHRALYVPAGEVLRSLRRALPVEELDRDAGAGGSSTERMYRVRGTRATFGLISPLSRHFCDRCDKIRITPEGGLKVCLFGDAISLREGLRRYREGEGPGPLMGTVSAALACKRACHDLACGSAPSRTGVPLGKAADAAPGGTADAGAAPGTAEDSGAGRGAGLVMHRTGG